jgi:hypothetical protein
MVKSQQKVALRSSLILAGTLFHTLACVVVDENFVHFLPDSAVIFEHAVRSAC